MTVPAEVRGQSLEKRRMELKMEASKALAMGTSLTDSSDRCILMKLTVSANTMPAALALHF